MQILGIVAAVVVAALAALLVYAATRPGTLVVQRSLRIGAAPDKIFPLVNDLGRWAAWSPYEKKDPAMKRTLSGAASGKGAIYAWEGNKNVGKGRMEIADAAPPSRIAIDLSFEKPFAAQNVVVFTFEPEGGATAVTWAMRGRSPFMAKLIGVFVDMDAMIGKDFEAGLANLKAVAEA